MTAAHRRRRLLSRLHDEKQRTDTMLQHTSGNKQAEQDADKESDEKLKEIKDIGGNTGSKVIEDLLKAVTDVRPEVPDRIEQPV